VTRAIHRYTGVLNDLAAAFPLEQPIETGPLDALLNTIDHEA
jgi:hypothetical protein